MLVVNPNNRLNSPFAAVEPPLWAGLIASYHDADILDAEAMGLTATETISEIRGRFDSRVLLVVMGNNPSVSSTPKMPVAEAIADALTGKTTMLGWLAPMFATTARVSMTGLHPIAVGSTYTVIDKPFEGTPMQPWHKLPMHLYRAHNWHCLDGSPRAPYASIYTSLNCPFDCYFCNIHTLYGDRKVRYRPLDDIVQELDVLTTRYQVRNIKIWDELFTLTNEHVLDVCEAFRYYHKKHDLNVWCYGRLSTMTWRKLDALRRAGVKWIAYGFESVKDPKCQGKTDDIIRMTKEAGIAIIGNFMFGLPGSTPEDDQASLDFAKKHLFEFVNFYDAKPYPGSQWYKDTADSVTHDWSEYGQYTCPSVARQRAFHEYFTNPAYLQMLQRKWGDQAVTQIQEMLKWSVVPAR